MSRIVLTSRSGLDSKLHLEIPVGEPDAEFQVEVVVRPKPTEFNLPEHQGQEVQWASDALRSTPPSPNRSFHRLGQVEAERIATEYAKRIGVRPFVIRWSTLQIDLIANKPIWSVSLGYCEPSDEIGVPDWVSIDVDDDTGVASHIEHL